MSGNTANASAFNSDPAQLNTLHHGEQDFFLMRLTVNESSADLTGCMEEPACNFDPKAVFPGPCAYPDADLDGILDCNDNCPGIANPGQEVSTTGASDCNLAAFPDACADSDGDGFSNAYELANGGNPCDSDVLPCFGIDMLCEDPCSGSCLADVSGDGYVGTDDLLLILAAFGASCD